MESGKKRSRSNNSSIKKSSAGQYVICVQNQDYPASLELRKIYQMIPDRAAAKAGLLRIVDGSGEDYLYPTDYFVTIKLPRTVEKAVRLAS